MKIDILYPRVPPVFDAIGEHNVCLAAALTALGATVRLLHLTDAPDEVPGVELVRLAGRRADGYDGLGRAVCEQGTDWLITEYNPFSYGRYGVNPRLPLVLAETRRAAPATRQALYVHEAFAPARTFRLALLAAAHRVQFAAARLQSDVVLTSSDVWAADFARWWPKVPAQQLRIGSNLPRSTGDPTELRRRFGIEEGALVAVVFGGLGGDRSLDMLGEALRAVREADGLCVYVGPSTDVFNKVAKQAAVATMNLGRLEAGAAADALRCADVGLAPFIDGVSPRRGSFLAMLQHGLAVVSTHGPLTGATMSRAGAAGCFVLTDCTSAAFADGVTAVAGSAADRSQLGKRAAAFYNEAHDWQQIARRYISTLFAEQEAVPT